MATTNFSKHMTEDRIDRYVLIATKVGFGEVVHSATCCNQHGRGRMELTSTGVVMVKGEDETLITMYCATIQTVKRYFGLKTISRELYNIIRTNEKRGYCNR